MICSLTGVVNRIGKDFCEVEVNGVGYLVRCGDRTLRQLSEGDEVKIHTYMAVSDKDQSLYGFLEASEVEMFKLLIGVNGVGPKSGAMILGSLSVEEILKAVSGAETRPFCEVKGVGKKAAQKIIIELKSKVGGLKELDLTGEGEIAEDEVFMSLKQLGFARVEIEKVLRLLPVEVVELEERLSWCLKNLG